MNYPFCTDLGRKSQKWHDIYLGFTVILTKHRIKYYTGWLNSETLAP